jgi:hypothetical protein
MKSRDLALIAILLAIGAVIYAFTPSIGGIFTIDTVASFAVLGILLVRPKLAAGVGIGVVAGLISMFFSKSSIAWFNVVVHICGAFVATWVTLRIGEVKLGGLSWKPAVVVTCYKIVAAGLFITTSLLLGFTPWTAYWTVAWPSVLLSTLSGIVICMVLYPPAKALYERQAGTYQSSSSK